jgi:RNA polymerase sigma-70 factor (ECF subfamily)
MRDREVEPASGARAELDSTASLLERIRQGHDDARERLFARVVPVLQRWAHRRLPDRARDLLDTDDLVQVTVLRALVRLKDFEYQGEGAFLGYLRSILINAIRERIRRAGRRPQHVALDQELLDRGPPILEGLIGRESIHRYETALDTLPADMRQALILRLEFEYSHQEIASELGRPSEDAARMTVARALAKLKRAMSAM